MGGVSTSRVSPPGALTLCLSLYVPGTSGSGAGYGGAAHARGDGSHRRGCARAVQDDAGELSIHRNRYTMRFAVARSFFARLSVRLSRYGCLVSTRRMERVRAMMRGELCQVCRTDSCVHYAASHQLWLQTDSSILWTGCNGKLAQRRCALRRHHRRARVRPPSLSLYKVGR
jgi:hypothetical protein